MSGEQVSGSAPQSILRLLSSLAAATVAGRITWQQLAPFQYRFDGGKGYVVLTTEPDEEAPFLFVIFDDQDQRLEAYEAPTRFSERNLDAALMRLWQTIILQYRGKTIEPVIESLIEAAGGDVSMPEHGSIDIEPPELDDLPF